MSDNDEATRRMYEEEVRKAFKNLDPNTSDGDPADVQRWRDN